MVFPKHINMTIEHQPHAAYYESVEDWLAKSKREDHVDVLPEDAAEMLKTGDVWVIQWYPNTPVGFRVVAAATLERALELANASE